MIDLNLIKYFKPNIISDSKKAIFTCTVCLCVFSSFHECDNHKCPSHQPDLPSELKSQALHIENLPQVSASLVSESIINTLNSNIYPRRRWQK